MTGRHPSAGGRRTRAAGVVLVVCALLAGVSGCGFHGLYNANLPGSVGGPFSGDKTYTITVMFSNVLDLVPQSAVKVGDVTIGAVEKVSLVDDPATKSYEASVTAKVKTSVHLPANATATLEETSLLGEKFVQLQAPATGAKGVLGNGSVIRDTSTSEYPDIETVFGVLSTVLNGGGLARLQTINTELAAALAGRESQVHDVFVQLNTFVGGLNTQRTEINSGIDALDRLSVTLNTQRSTIATALDDLGPGFKVLSDERANLVRLLESLADLGSISSRVIAASATQTKADLTALEPILGELNRAGKALPGALDLLLDYPFPADATAGIPGDDTSLFASLDATSACNLQGLSTLCTLLGIKAGSGGLIPPVGGLLGGASDTSRASAGAAVPAAVVTRPVAGSPLLGVLMAGTL